MSRSFTNWASGSAFVPISAIMLSVEQYCVAIWWSSILLRIVRVSKSIALDAFPRDPRLLDIWIAAVLSWYRIVGLIWGFPSSDRRFLRPNISVEVSKAVFNSALDVAGDVRVCFLDVMDTAAEFIIPILQPCGLGSLRFASPYEYRIFLPCGSNPFEYINPISFVVRQYSNSLTAIPNCLADHPTRRDPMIEMAYRISNLQFDAGYDKIPTACKKGRCLASLISSSVAGVSKIASSVTLNGLNRSLNPDFTKSLKKLAALSQYLGIFNSVIP